MRIEWLALLLTVAVPASAAAVAPRAEAVDALVKPAMARIGAKGLALAVIDDGRVALVRTYGVRNAAGDPLLPDTILYGASLTKTMFAYAVMQMVDERLIDLDRPIAEMLPKPLPDYGNLDAYEHWGDLADDPRWRRITPRMVLTHSTGFANYAFVEPDGRLRIHFDPGSRYAYSGAGMLLLQFAIDQGLGRSMGPEMQRRVFTPLGMVDSSAMWRPDFAGHLADGWTAQGQVVAHDERSRVRLSGSVDTSIADVARFAAGLVRGTGLSARARAEMLRGQLPITTAAQFPTLQPDVPPAARLPIRAGLGVMTFAGPQGPGFYKTGHDEQTGNIMVCLERGRRCVVILSNDVRSEALFPELVHALLGETGLPWRWEYGATIF